MARPLRYAPMGHGALQCATSGCVEGGREAVEGDRELDLVAVPSLEA